jgi:hypothetical protein
MELTDSLKALCSETAPGRTHAQAYVLSNRTALVERSSHPDSPGAHRAAVSPAAYRPVRCQRLAHTGSTDDARPTVHTRTTPRPTLGDSPKNGAQSPRWASVRVRCAPVTTRVIHLDHGPEHRSRRTPCRPRMVEVVPHTRRLLCPPGVTGDPPTGSQSRALRACGGDSGGISVS